MFQLDFASHTPIYEQICNNIIKLASVGAIKAGDKLPPVRILASQLGINPNTVAKAYRTLEIDGYIFSTVGRGSFMTDKLSSDLAYKLIAIDNFKSSVENAHLYGIEKDNLIDIIEQTYKGGISFDRDC